MQRWSPRSITIQKTYAHVLLSRVSKNSRGKNLFVLKFMRVLRAQKFAPHATHTRRPFDLKPKN